MEEWDNSSTEKGWDISFSDLNYEDMFAVGGHIDVNSNGNYVSTRDVRFSDYVDVAKPLCRRINYSKGEI